MAIEQNVLRSCVALKLITNGLDMAHDMREQRRGATEPARQHEEGTTVRQYQEFRKRFQLLIQGSVHRYERCRCQDEG